MNEQKYKTTPKSIGVENIREAEWNVHAKASGIDADLKGLMDSIRANGMMHRIVVREVGTGVYEVIDGHRRLQAAKLMGWFDAPCEVVSVLSDAEAQAMTATANLQRMENDPLLEAALIERLADAGKTYEKIAAVIGKDARYVARRARLCNLTQKWRDWFGSVEVDADTMEMVAAHEKPLQDEVFDALEIGDGEGEVDADDIEDGFKRRLRRLDEETPFDMGECANCPYNTATHGWLFAPEEDAECKGRCEKAECYVAKWNGRVDERIAALRKKKVAVREAKQKWDIPNYWSATPAKTKKNRSLS